LRTAFCSAILQELTVFPSADVRKWRPIAQWPKVMKYEITALQVLLNQFA
jgi:hypothetical protein